VRGSEFERGLGGREVACRGCAASAGWRKRDEGWLPGGGRPSLVSTVLRRDAVQGASTDFCARAPCEPLVKLSRGRLV
jgi:hypothetical protein